MAGYGFEAILPRRPIAPPPSQQRAGVDRFIRDAAAFTVNQLQDYPPARPWKNRPPKSGPRAGGRRTGAYGRGWPVGLRVQRDRFVVYNTVAYAAWVGGSRRTYPGQARAMQARGWKSVDDVIPIIRRKYNGRALMRYIGGSRI